MTDREKIVSVFDSLRQFVDMDIHPIVSPDNWLAYSNLRDAIDVAEENIIALLKEQEPILLENQHKPYGISTNANSPWISRCPTCGKKVEGKQTKFCKYCGQAVRWN